LVKWCHEDSILPNVGTTWITLETSMVPEAVLGSPYISVCYIVNSEDYVIVSPCHSKQMEAISETVTCTLKVSEKQKTVTNVRFVSDNLWRSVLTVDGLYKISHALFCAE
jgi:nitroimidazol reductase NimA-like FMN-containing flavoprotein (pyridoxamine 5'-phosphate oxidase superfamily)